MPRRLHEEILERLRALPGAERMEIPPPIYRDLGGEITRYEEGALIEARWPAKEVQRGPTGLLQGGMLTTFFDATVGPLAYLAGGADLVSLDLETAFLRPVPPEVDHVMVTVRVVERTRRVLFLEGEARRPDGKVAATFRTKMMSASG